MVTHTSGGLPMRPDVDVVIVGGGLAGCIAAVSLHDLGATVAVVDRASEPRAEFRAEQIVGPQLERLQRLGLLGAASGDTTLTTTNARNGVILDRTTVDQVGMPYRDMVANARDALPADTLTVGRVVAVETSPTRQRVRLDDGTTIDARLVILATGLVPQLRTNLGIETEMVSAAHSLCIGFDIVLADPARAGTIPLIYYGERIATRVDYLALFQVGDTVRANLFCYQARTDDWPRAFLDDPDAMLHDALPRLRAVVGDVAIVGPIEMRENDIRVATHVVRDGLVAIGDAFQTPCPSAGTGIDRILSDIDALMRHYPTWVRTGSVGSAAIAAFYDDPAKRAFDAECIRIALYRKAFSTEPSFGWRLHRSRVVLQRRLLAALRDLAAASRCLRALAHDHFASGVSDGSDDRRAAL